MARIIGGIGTSHVPTIGVAYDKGRQDERAWQPLFEGYKAVAGWLAEQEPDALVFFYNDHCTTLFFDCYPTFALGVGERFQIADEGAGQRPLPPLKGDVDLQKHIAESLVNDEIDLSVFQGRPVDHGCASPLPLLWPHEPDWPGSIVPIAINVLQYPLPTARRCFRLGQAVRRAVESYPQDLRVVVVGTGGLSHQVHGERAGFNDTDWDMRFLDLFRDDPEALLNMTHADYVRRGGAESVEQIMWLAMRGALPGPLRELHRNYYLATSTAMAVTLYEQADGQQVRNAGEQAGVRRSAGNPQLAGIEGLDGTYPFDIGVSHKALTLNRFLWNLRKEDCRRRFHDDEEAAMAAAGLSDQEQSLVRSRDWIGLIRSGANFFAIEKFARTVGVSNLEMYAQMRGETFEAFMQTRRVPEAR
ncbi:MAG TPA: gallate dioxygenase [Gammaproteobacteria bacterium]|nr:gallate dioxygenase [Gammaproteobacteria bacterium]